MNIHLVRIPGEEMRYDTAGDWFYDEHGDLIVQVDSAVSEDDFILIAVHELVEATLCDRRGVTQEMVDDFDLGAGLGEKEPGDAEEAPYKREHRFAMLIEHLLAHEMGKTGYGTVI